MNSREENVGDNYSIDDGDILTMEIDLRSNKKERRILKYYLNEKRQEIYFTHLPSSVKLAVY